MDGPGTDLRRYDVKRLLVVDDDPPMLKVLGVGLRAFDFTVLTAPDAGTALDLAARVSPEAVLLDLGLPDLDGLDVLRSLRAWSAVPVLVMSGRRGIASRVAALDAGADDYVTKPFAIEELRRPPPRGAAPPGHAAAAGAGGPRPLHRRPRRLHHRPHRRDRPRRRPPDPHRVAAALAAAAQPRPPITGREILTEVWGAQHVTRTNYLRVLMAALRRKLEQEPSTPAHLITEPGLGYRFQP